MVERVADRLWIVRDHKVDQFEGDLEDYRKFIIQAAREEKKQTRKKEKAAEPAKKKASGPKRSLGMIEDEIQRLSAEKEKLEAKMASAYSEAVQKEYDRVCAELEVQEAAFLEM
jgi:ATP-binding cassette subfamily F protein 3